MKPTGDTRKRAFPKKIHAWDDHTETVIEHRATRTMAKSRLNTYLSCWSNDQERCDEQDERSYTKEHVLMPLGLKFGASREPDGRPDDCLWVSEGEAEGQGPRRPGVLLEEKSTHQLRIPERLDDILEAWSQGDWRTTRPFGQLFRQLLLNDASRGVVLSATRTYFAKAEVVDGQVRFSVSRRWYPAEPLYLRAWDAHYHAASTIQLGENALRCKGGPDGGGWRLPWREDDTTDSPKRDEDKSDLGGGGGDDAPDDDDLGDDDSGGGDDDDEGARGASDRPDDSPGADGDSDENDSVGRGEPPLKKNKPAGGAGTEAAGANCVDDEPWERPNALRVPEIGCDDVVLLKDERLGCGRNGPVTVGRWGDRRVAIKQFDLDHGGGPSFQRELEAYAALRDLQGQAVAKLHFVSRSWCGTLRLMGLDLGEPVKGDEPNHPSELRRVKAALKEAGWRQDVEEDVLENYVWLRDDPSGDDKLVAIDLELLERRAAG